MTTRADHHPYWLDENLTDEERRGGWTAAIRRSGRPGWVFRFMHGDDDNAVGTLVRLNQSARQKEDT